MQDITIRLCQREDLPQVLLLMNELSQVASGDNELCMESMQRVFEDMERYPEIYMNMVAEHSGRLAGFISVIFYKTVFHKGGTALINELVVTEKARGLGIGSALVQWAKKEAIARGMDELEVGTEKANIAARRFYAKCGFDEEYILLGMEF